MVYLRTHVHRINPPAKSTSAALRQRADDLTLRKFDFLFVHYTPTAWYTEAVDAVRRVAMTGMLVFVPVGIGLLLVFSWHACR